MKYSVIIPVYNVEKYLERCLDSILEQNYGEYEVILINDGSTDGSKKICEEYEKKYRHIRLINQKNSGSGSSRNKGIELARGKYIFFCDPDDYITGDFFSEVEYMLDEDADVLFFEYHDEIERNSAIISSKKMTFLEEVDLDKKEFREKFVELFETNMLYTLWNKLYKKSFLINNQLKFTTKSMGQDTRFNLNVYEKLNKLKIIKKGYYHYIKKREGSSTTRYREDRLIFKLEEFRLIKDLMVKIQVHDFDLLNTIAINITIDSATHILNSDLSYQNKIKKIKNNNLIVTNEFKDYIRDSNNIQVILLRNNKIHEFIFLKKIYSFFKKY